MNAPAFARLLLATEHLEYDRGAEAVALALARRCQLPLAAVLPLVHNAELEMVAPERAAQADAEAGARRRALAAAAEAAGVQLEIEVRRGPELYAEIVAEALEQAADLLIIRRRGRLGLLANLLVGEMVSKVVAHTPCSVLVAPRETGLWSRSVLVGVDPQQPDPSLVACACDVAAECQLPLHVVCVATHPAERAGAEAALAHALAQCGGTPASGEVRQGRAHAELIAAAAARGADLLVVGRHGGSPIARAWIGGVAQKVIGLANCPVLVHVPTSRQRERP
jgi:nucleotide-binding universal stress UspA family protein